MAEQHIEDLPDFEFQIDPDEVLVVVFDCSEQWATLFEPLLGGNSAHFCLPNYWWN